MANLETEALVLRSYNLSDADKIVVFLTQKYGLIKAVAKGAKRLKSKFGGSIEPFSIVSISYFQKEERELVNIKQIELLRSFLKEASNLEFLSKFEYATELLTDFSPPNDPNQRLYNMTKICLETASSKNDSLEGIILYFEIWLLKLGGFLPSWKNCNQCKRVIGENETANFQFDFHLTCNNCQKYSKGISISATQRVYFETAQKISPGKFHEFTKENEQDLRSLSEALRKIISQVLGKDFVGEKILTAKINT